MLDGWTLNDIAGKPADVFHPPGVDRPRFAVVFLHPVALETPTDNIAWTAELARHGLACCAPHGMRSWWVDRVCPEFDPELTSERHILDNVVPWVRERWQLGTKPLAAVGISMGGQGAVRLGFRRPDVFPVVGSIAGAFDMQEYFGQGSPLDEMYPDAEACRQDTAILQLDPARCPPHVWFTCDPTDMPWYRGNDRLHEKLSAYGLPHTADLDTSAGGHTWDYFDAMAGPLFAFVAAALAQEGRRLM